MFSVSAVDLVPRAHKFWNPTIWCWFVVAEFLFYPSLGLMGAAACWSVWFLFDKGLVYTEQWMQGPWCVCAKTNIVFCRKIMWLDQNVHLLAKVFPSFAEWLPSRNPKVRIRWTCKTSSLPCQRKRSFFCPPPCSGERFPHASPAFAGRSLGLAERSCS